MKLHYKKSKIYPDYYIICFKDIFGEIKILSFLYATSNYDISRIDFINMMRMYNGTNTGLSYNMKFFDYMFFPTEKDVINAIEHLESVMVINKLAENYGYDDTIYPWK